MLQGLRFGLKTLAIKDKSISWIYELVSKYYQINIPIRTYIPFLSDWILISPNPIGCVVSVTKGLYSSTIRFAYHLICLNYIYLFPLSITLPYIHNLRGGDIRYSLYLDQTLCITQGLLLTQGYNILLIAWIY